MTAERFSDSLEFGLQAAYGNPAPKAVNAELANQKIVGRIISNRCSFVAEVAEPANRSQKKPLDRVRAPGG